MKNVEISEELMIERWEQGVRVIKPSTSHTTYASVSSLMRMPLNFYFIDNDSVMMKLNEQTAQTCGYASVKDAVGRSIRDVAKIETAHNILKNDREIIRRKIFNVYTESYSRLDGMELNAISIKFPCYYGGEVIGIFGCSILQGYENHISLSESIFELIQTGLLSPSHSFNQFFDKNGDEIYLTEREKEILYWLVRGNTAKSIGNKVGLSPRTIEHKLEQIKMKLSVYSKSELIDRAINLFINEKH